MQHILRRVTATLARYEQEHAATLTEAEAIGHKRVLAIVAIALSQTDYYNVLALLREFEELEAEFKKTTDRQNERNRELKIYNTKLQQRLERREKTIYNQNLALRGQDQELKYLRSFTNRKN